jgi:hypothetical protein
MKNQPRRKEKQNIKTPPQYIAITFEPTNHTLYSPPAPQKQLHRDKTFPIQVSLRQLRNTQFIIIVIVVHKVRDWLNTK